MAAERLRVLIAGGGTGGHILPALAVARVLVEQHNAAVRFLGTTRGLETRLVPAAGFPLDCVQVGQLNNVSLATRLRTAAGLPLSVAQCVRLLRSFRPHVVFGVGGYASGPAMLAALLTRTPRMAFEPNAVAGMVNRWIGPYVQAAAVNFASAASAFCNATVTGIPVRAEFFSLPPLPSGAPPHLLIFGGSQGARIFNTTLPQIATPLLEAVPGLTLLHQCGAGHVQTTEAAYAQSGAERTRWQVREFLDDMPQRFAAASLILCRSGASTVAELAAAGKPALLVPFPLAADDHQRRNAEALAEAGAATMLLQAALTPESLLAELRAHLSNPERLAVMGTRARPLAHPHAAETIAQMLVQLCAVR
jgi:UDP-N-acetylglucosamine--N-acetylmuramyl-(pentapeptide) pyrophosphoryl-undecaprenol N-acetylglucosamine transferase